MVASVQSSSRAAPPPFRPAAAAPPRPPTPNSAAPVRPTQPRLAAPAQGRTAPAPGVAARPSTALPAAGAGIFRPPTRAPEGILRPGAQGEPVARLQDALSTLGYMQPLSPAQGYGRFGPQTALGVRNFQLAHGIPVAGQYGPQSQQALQGALDLFNKPKGLAQTPEDANKFYVSQWGGTPSNSAKGAPYGYADCGPTSGLMALSALGLTQKPSPADAEKAIDAVRDRCLGYDSKQSQLMDFPTLAHGLNAYGAKTRMVNGVENFEAALGRGNPVIVGGEPWAAWGAQERAKGNYLGDGPAGHFVTVMGKNQDGQYIVADPLFKNGPIAVSYDQLRTFARFNLGAMEVSR